MLVSLLQGVVICTVSWFLWKYFRQVFVKSPLDNIPGPPTGSFFYGNLGQLLEKNGWGFLQYLTESYNGIVKLHGPLGHRMLYIFDPTALHNIIIKDQYIFEEPAWFIRSNRLNFGPGLLATLGDHHRKQRKTLNPVFSIAHMRRMIPIFNAVTHRLTDAIEARVRGNGGERGEKVEVDLLMWMGRTALELVGQAGLGYSFDPLTADKPDVFAHAIKGFQPTMARINFLRRLLPYIPEFRSIALNRAVLALIPSPNVRQLREIIHTMHRRSVEIFEEKKAALARGDETVTRQIGEGKDIMSILMRANMEASEENRMLEEELIGQMSTLIFAAMDTTSTALSITLTILADNPAAQEKLRSEVLQAMTEKGGDLDYDELVALPYLDAVCRETLRLHAPVATLFRETREDVVLPLSQPIRGVDGTEIHEIPIPKDTTVAVGILSSNRNRAIWGDDAMEWKPERWLAPLPDSVQDAKIPGVYSNLMTFLGGGRACIGFKFSQLEMKVVLCLLLSKFTFSPSAQPTFWNLSGVRYPTVGSNPKPCMPLKVGLYKAPEGASA